MTGITRDARSWNQALARYRQPCCARSVLELAITVVLFLVMWTAMWASIDIGYWLCLLLALPTAAALMRLFMIQHDCGHGALFRHRAANDWVGRIIGVFTLTPYAVWRRNHATHHASVGNLDHRGLGDIDTLTVSEYLAFSRTGRAVYRTYRNPVVMFGLLPAYVFVLHYRLPFGLMRAGVHPWLSAMGTNAAIAGVVMTMAWLIGMGPFLMVNGPVVLLAACMAMWFFYVQHQFEETLMGRGAEWDFHTAALHGSSTIDLPEPLAWFSGNIGLHHVHHLCSRIPFYRLSEVLRDQPELTRVGRLTFLQSIRCATLSLWDERQQRLISIGELHRRRSRFGTNTSATTPEMNEKESRLWERS